MKIVFLTISILILFAEIGNCQWYYKRYDVNNINQLSQEQLYESLDITKGAILGGSVISAIGLSGLTYAIIDLNRDFVPGDLGLIYPYIIRIVSIPVIIVGQFILWKNIFRIKEIKGVLKNIELSFRLTNYPPYSSTNYSNNALIPCISVTFHL